MFLGIHARQVKFTIQVEVSLTQMAINRTWYTKILLKITWLFYAFGTFDFEKQ
jgi:hypothetical protein